MLRVILGPHIVVRAGSVPVLHSLYLVLVLSSISISGDAGNGEAV